MDWKNRIAAYYARQPSKVATAKPTGPLDWMAVVNFFIAAEYDDDDLPPDVSEAIERLEAFVAANPNPDQNRAALIGDLFNGDDEATEALDWLKYDKGTGLQLVSRERLLRDIERDGLPASLDNPQESIGRIQRLPEGTMIAIAADTE